MLGSCAALVVVSVISYGTHGFETPKQNFTNVVESFGYPTEVHEVETEDGYLLNVFRVPYGQKSEAKQPNEYPVIINHGLMGSAENFIIGGPKKALPYVLADHGYDVWLCNARGTHHSRKHRTLDPDKDMAKFWRFSWHEIGVYDLPAVIDYVLNITQKSKVNFIGHSQGTTTFFVMGAERPEYNDKIGVMVGMAPSAFLGHLKDPSIRFFAPNYRYLQSLAESLQVYELIPKFLLSNEALRSISKILCEEDAPTRNICSNVLLAMAGYTPGQIDPDTITLIVSTGPGGASVYQALHYAQLVTTGRFIKYDWGSKENLKRYNSTKPPEYNFNNIKSPVALMYGESDIVVTKEDVEILATHLPNLVDFYKVPYESWSHMDFVWAKDLDKYVNKRLLRILKKFRE
ncbi:lipase 3-like [Anthonomus grandis grandis]|uniref:lipase 3-like n=1 Tax=Anthonomus grandis grandis TaxID=2921223 RepID=UPI0021660829|nr:lipase 3-like [Anthonomus grandis grandis]